MASGNNLSHRYFYGCHVTWAMVRSFGSNGLNGRRTITVTCSMLVGYTGNCDLILVCGPTPGAS
jgi:hypothetical protein